MLEGLMQHDHPLTLQLVLERMRGINGDAEVVTFTGDGTTRASYAEVGERVDRLCRGHDGVWNLMREYVVRHQELRCLRKGLRHR